MQNCAGADSTKFRALLDILNFLKSLVGAGKLAANLIDEVYAILRGIIGGKLATGQAKPSDIRRLTNQYLPAAIAQAKVNVGQDIIGAAPFAAGAQGLAASSIAGFLNGSEASGSFFDPTRLNVNPEYALGQSSSIPLSFSNGINDSPVGNFDPNAYFGKDRGNPTNPAAGGTNSDYPYGYDPSAGYGTNLGSLSNKDGTGGMDSTGSFTNGKWSANGNPNEAIGTVGTSNATPGGVAVSGSAITSDEIRDYFNGYVRSDDDSFNILLWLGAGKNPMLMLDALSFAKRLHNDIVLPVATYYKQLIYGSPTYPIRLGQIIYGIVSEKVITSELRGGPSARHRLGQAGNFKVLGVDNDKIVEDISNGRIRVEYGTVALTTAVHVTLPFFATNGQVVRSMKLWTDNGVPNFVGYQFNS